MIFAACVGFPERGAASLLETYHRICERGTLVEAGGFKYLKWEAGERVELWTDVKDGKPEMLFKPFYAGETRMKVALIEKTLRRDEVVSDGAFLCRGKACEGAGWVAGHNPFIFDAIDFHRYDSLSLPRVSTVQLTAFSFQLTGFEDEEAYEEAYPADADGYCWDYKHFIPALICDPQRGEGGELQSAHAEVSGYVNDTGIITNAVTGRDFCWARLDTVGGEVDVVCPPDRLSGYLVKGGIAASRCYLYGRVVEDRCN
ncbi:MAG: hypothetical protein JOZ02_13695 [Acidobacteria bacterium]|nr:hypothetical protein [Acidobacteriota bacterium]